jgi:hypothetical protein
MKRRTYQAPPIDSERCFESSALGSGKTSDPPPGSFHFGSGYYDAFTGHLGPGFGGSESVSGTAILSSTPGLFSQSYVYSGRCQNWVTWQS